MDPSHVVERLDSLKEEVDSIQEDMKVYDVEFQANVVAMRADIEMRMKKETDDLRQQMSEMRTELYNDK